MTLAATLNTKKVRTHGLRLLGRAIVPAERVGAVVVLPRERVHRRRHRIRRRRLVITGSVAAVPALTGVTVDKRVRDRVNERLRRGVVYGLPTVTGARLAVGGVGVL